ncbi:hypothetical protein [Flavobacterium sp. W22_SRS_FP1]|uniref:hypothetical protein n=1 Tax=Flavobacterium sp. W22_SRS_FP1 TaxID=3240276 RepID=UPI003F8EBC26
MKVRRYYEPYFDVSLPYYNYSEYFIGLSTSNDFSDIEWYNYDENWDKGFDLIKIVGLISVALSNEDFIDNFKFFEYYNNFESIEINQEIDYEKLKKDWWSNPLIIGL